MVLLWIERLVAFVSGVWGLANGSVGATIVIVGILALVGLPWYLRGISTRPVLTFWLSIALAAATFASGAFLFAPGPWNRHDCTGVVRYRSDPAMRNLQCNPTTLLKTSFDFDNDEGDWEKPEGAAGDDWRARADLVVTATDVRTTSSSVRLVPTKEADLSFLDCADRDMAPSRQTIPLSEVREVHGLCVVTNGSRRALIKINGGKNSVGPIRGNVVVWQKR